MKHDPAFVKLVEGQRKHVKEVTVSDVVAKQKAGENFVLIDVREDHEWEKGHIPGAIHMGRGIIERDIGSRSIQPDETVILYCGGGYRSILSAANLQLMGYSNTFSMDGGYRGWREAGLPIVEGETDD